MEKRNGKKNEDQVGSEMVRFDHPAGFSAIPVDNRLWPVQRVPIGG
jgi:hypothetical protein